METEKQEIFTSYKNDAWKNPEHCCKEMQHDIIVFSDTNDVKVTPCCFMNYDQYISLDNPNWFQLLTEVREKYFEGDRSMCTSKCGSQDQKDRRSLPKNPEDVWYIQPSIWKGCNMQCAFCSTRKGDQKSTEKRMFYANVLEDKLDWKKIKRISWGDGEFFADKEGRDWYVEMMQKYNLELFLITNGILWDEELLNSLYIQDKIWGVMVSIYGFEDEQYDMLCKSENGATELKEQLPKIIDFCKRTETLFFPKILVNSINYTSVIDITKYLIRLGVPSETIQLVDVNDVGVSMDRFLQLYKLDPVYDKIKDVFKILTNNDFILDWRNR
jgi:pyruvate-formate lyase-activating enzyme